MTFTYTFRNPKGILEAGLVDAPDRTSALKRLRSNGISVIQLKEGSSKLDADKGVGPGDFPGKWPRYLLGALFVCIVAAVFWFLRDTQKGDVAETMKARTPQHTSHSQETVLSSKANLPKPTKSVGRTEQAAVPPKPAGEPKAPGAFAPNMLRLPNGMELRFRLPEKGQVRRLVAGGEIWEVDSDGNIVNKTPPPIFEKPFEAGLSSLVERDGKVLPFILDNISDDEALKMCKEPTFSFDDDTPEITKMRENVAMMKTGALAYIQHGGKFADFVKEMREFSQSEQRLHIEGLRKVHEYVKNGQITEALTYFDQYSRELKEQGYSGIKIPKFIQKQMLSIEKEEK